MHVVFIIVGLALTLASGLAGTHHTGAPPTMHTMDGGSNGSGSGGSISGGGPAG